MNWRRLIKKIFGPYRGEAESYLLKELAEEEFLLLKHCLERLGQDYRSLFWFCEDKKVHNQMELYATGEGFTSIEKVFSKEEIGVILKAEDLLSVAPVDVREELRVFCHA